MRKNSSTTIYMNLSERLCMKIERSLLEHARLAVISFSIMQLSQVVQPLRNISVALPRNVLLDDERSLDHFFSLFIFACSVHTSVNRETGSRRALGRLTQSLVQLRKFPKCAHDCGRFLAEAVFAVLREFLVDLI